MSKGNSRSKSSSSGRLGAESNAILDQANKKVAEVEERLKSFPSGISVSDLVKSIGQIKSATESYNMLGNTTSETEKYLNKSRKALEVAIDVQKVINARENAQNATQETKDAASTFQIYTDVPLTALNITADSKEDAVIINKIKEAIVSKACGYRSFENYAGSTEIKAFFDSIAIDRYKYARFKEMHTGSESVMLFGPPGTGKTLLAEAVANELKPYGVSFISVSASDVKSRFVGDTEKGITFLFKVARELTNDGMGNYGKKPCVIFMDEVDGLIDEGSSGVGTGLLSTFNNEVAGFNGKSNEGLIIIAATNYPDKIPPAAFQRFSNRIFIGLPSLDNVREILVGKINKLGWSAFNFNNESLPLWMRSVDLERKEFITNYLEPDVAKQWGFLGQFVEGGSDQSNFAKTADADDLNKDWPVTGPSEVGEVFFNVTADPKNNPWDLIDFMTYYLWVSYYAPREIDGIFNMMLVRAEQRSVVFATNNPTSTSGEYYQKWLLEKKKITKPIERDGKCDKNGKEITRFAMVPLNYTSGEKATERRVEESFGKRFEKDINQVRFGEVWGWTKDTHKDGTFQYKRVAKYDLKAKNENNKKQELKVVVTKVTLKQSVPVQKIINKGEQPKIKRTYSLVRKQTKPLDLEVEDGEDIDTQNITFVETDDWNQKDIPADERLDENNIADVLGICQQTFEDFTLSVQDIRSIPIKNVDKMIEYAENYGRSLKGGADIEQLKAQAAEMKSAPPDDGKYRQIFHQFIDAVTEAYEGK
jgi:hypothetical protein